MRSSHLLRAIVATAAVLAFPISASAQMEKEITIDALSNAGWQIAGYTSTFGGSRSTFILFRHPDKTYLVQCQTGYDVTRSSRIYRHCYELR